MRRDTIAKMNNGCGGMMEKFDGREVFVSIVGEDGIDWLADSASKGDTSSRVRAKCCFFIGID